MGAEEAPEAVVEEAVAGEAVVVVVVVEAPEVGAAAHVGQRNSCSAVRLEVQHHGYTGCSN